MGISRMQREIIIGIVLGDGYLQMTGRKNARLRIEQSARQKDYIYWKYEQLKNIMQAKPKSIKRFNPVWGRSYSYYRCQTHSMPVLGQLRNKFYKNGRKNLPDDIQDLLKSELTLAVWYMDDGYLYNRDKMAYIYLPRYSIKDQRLIVSIFKQNFGLSPRIIVKKDGNLVARFKVDDTKRLCELVNPHIIPSMKYKILPTP